MYQIDSHDKNKTAIWPSYLYHRDPYSGKTVYLHWDNPLLFAKNKHLKNYRGNLCVFMGSS